MCAHAHIDTEEKLSLSLSFSFSCLYGHDACECSHNLLRLYSSRLTFVASTGKVTLSATEADTLVSASFVAENSPLPPILSVLAGVGLLHFFVSFEQHNGRRAQDACVEHKMCSVSRALMHSDSFFQSAF